jgi:hypothetical protein
MNYITYSLSQPEGIGSLLQYILSCYFLSKIMNIKFVYTPIKNIEHMSWCNYLSQSEWDDLWNNYITNYFLPKDDIVLIDDLNEKNMNTVKNTLDFQNYQNTLFILDANYIGKRYLDKYLNSNKHIIQNISSNYFNNTSHIYSYFKQNRINIAVHIRKYTKTDCDPSSFREYYAKNGESDLYFYSLISNLIKLFENRNIDIHIYTQLSPDEDSTMFDHYFNLKNDYTEIFLHKGNDTLSDIHHMIISDILILSKSSFSAIANYYTKGISIIKNSFWHTLKDPTLFVESNGNLNDKQKEYILNNIIS